MNIKEINPGTFSSIKAYLLITLPLTTITAWIIIAFQSTYIFPENTDFVKRLGWPIYLLLKMIKNWQQNQRVNDSKFQFSITSKQ